MSRYSPEPGQSSCVTEASRCEGQPEQRNTNMGKVVIMADTMHEGNSKLPRNPLWGVGGAAQSDLPTPALACTAMPTQKEKFAVVTNIKETKGPFMICGSSSALLQCNNFLPLSEEQLTTQTKERKIFAITVLKRQPHAF